MKITVLHCIPDLPARGAQRMLLRLVHQLNSNTFKTVIVSLTNGGSLVPELTAAGATVHELGMTRGIPSPRALLSLRQIMKATNPSLIQGWMYHANLAVALGASLAGLNTPIIWNIRRALYDVTRDKPLTRLVIKTGARLSQRPVAIIHNAEISISHHQAVGYSRGNHLIIGNGFPLEELKPSPTAGADLREHLSIKSDCQIVGLVACFDPQKDFQNFFNCAARTLEQRPNTHFVLVGKGVEDSNTAVRKCIEQASTECKSVLADHTHLLGEIKDVAPVISGFDVFVSSAENEGFPNVVGEAMACGVPCVVTDAGASRELVEGSGFVVPCKNHKALSDALLKMLSYSKDELLQKGSAARQKMKDHYSIEVIADRYAQLYQQVVNGTFPEKASNWNLR